MKMFFIGMGIMYLATSIIIFILGNLGKDIDDIYCYIFAPHFTLIAISFNKINHHFKYRNLKSMVYDFDKKQWFYCERKDFDKLSKTLRQSNNFNLETFHKALDKFNEQYREYYDKKYVDWGGTVNRRYTPKKVWENFEKIYVISI